ncbi:MAG: hypothetical protein HYV27_01775 [Candidatus Hydrogenedentes bacterium]|nr:hypothetical protein [Candidatus Hydrogenedentota bacterium]
MFRVGFGEILVIIIIAGMVYLRYRTQKAMAEAKVHEYVRYIAPVSRGGQGAWKIVVSAFAAGIAVSAGLVYLVWRYFLSNQG